MFLVKVTHYTVKKVLIKSNGSKRTDRKFTNKSTQESKVELKWNPVLGAVNKIQKSQVPRHQSNGHSVDCVLKARVLTVAVVQRQ